MKILLTGASGFIGRSLAARLAQLGHETIGLVHNTPAPPTVSRVVRASLGSEQCGIRLVDECGPVDAVIHAAAWINYQTFCPDVVRINCFGLQQLLAFAEHCRAHTFVNISSIGVVGTPSFHPITEHHPTRPRTAYHASKLFGEHLVSCATTPRMSGVSLRITAPVGVGMPDRILSVFVRRAAQGHPLLLSGTGVRIQNYIDVRDVCAAIQLCLKHRPNGVFNVAGPYALSNQELAKRCVHLLKSGSSIDFNGHDDPCENENWTVSSEAARTAFEYQPLCTIDESIRSVSESQKDCQMRNTCAR